MAAKTRRCAKRRTRCACCTTTAPSASTCTSCTWAWRFARARRRRPGSFSGTPAPPAFPTGRTFTAAGLEAGWRAQGYEVGRSSVVDLEPRRGGRLTLVACRRWKAATTGGGPVRELHAAGRAREAHEVIYVAGGEITQQARMFAEANAIRLVQGPELAGLVKLKPAR